MDNTIQNNQNQDHKTQKTASILKKAYWGLWGVYVMLIIGIVIYNENSRYGYMDDSPILFVLFTILIGIIPVVYGFKIFIESKGKESFVFHTFSVGVLALVIHFFTALMIDKLDCGFSGWCGLGAFATAFWGGISIIVGIVFGKIISIIIRKKHLSSDQGT